MESSIQVPKELESLLSCGLCRRPFNLATGLLPKELVCQHSFCEECVSRSTVQESTECICYLCGVRTKLQGHKLPESLAIMFLLRELPALVLGRAMLDFSKRNSSSGTIEVSGEESKDSPSDNWLDEICVDSFLASSAEHCFIHAMPNSTWCHNCQRLLCRACSDVPMHREHRMVRQLDYHDVLRQLLTSELAKIKRTVVQSSELATREMILLRELCEACYHVQLHIKRVILEHQPSMVSSKMVGWHQRAELNLSRSAGSLTGVKMMQLLTQLVQQRRKFEGQLAEVHFQCRLRAAVQENGMQVLDFERLNDRLLRLRRDPRPGVVPANVEPPRALILTNYCVFAYWSEMQRLIMPTRPRTPPPDPELLPQSRRAVVPPRFNHRQREAEVRLHMQHVELDQNRALSRQAEDGFSGSGSGSGSGSSSSPSSSNSNSQSTFSSLQGNSTAPQQTTTYVLDMEQFRMVEQYRERVWQEQQQWQMQQYLQQPYYQMVQPDASWANWEEQWWQQQQPQIFSQQNQDYHQDGTLYSAQANWPDGY
ncbi:uncharacterized protein LOC119547152 isoform X2 [Drosophila subpulchrella]|uniref:uncharacterized protein LOC119547152 isoform X2 n=1 Tax=Drosophila subpulchrella TaxID=1486046 RepID=UPI0018A13437|nr:uncharacterized protein LOC119547152 isoform X2 [Drosophila subpulchrella]